jgi:ArsR family transcriptional regulator, arsenate/arsenite/antimonite-responsive transcriptional repressor / arsenate reductase (thioredoxin)
MTPDSPPEILKLLAHDLRWQIVRRLAGGDYRVNELVAHVDQPLNLVSYHLRQLREQQVVQARRSEADGRDTYYSLDLDHLGQLYQSAGAAIHPALVTSGPQSATLAHRPSVLFVCTHNSARSQMAEALMRHLSGGQVQVSSAGSEPSSVHPDAITTMATLGIDIRHQRSQGFADFHDQAFDVIITVCDRAREVCPTFPGDGQHIHWGYPDPAALADPQARRQAFADTARRLQARIAHFLSGLQAGGTG